MHRLARTAYVVGLAIALAAVVGCQQAAQPPTAAPATPDYAAEYGPKVEAFLQVWNSKDYAQLDGIVAESFVRRAPDQNADGREAMKAFMQQVHATYPDFRIVANAVGFGPDVAFTQWTVTGTYTPEGAEPKTIETSGATMLRFAGGLIAEERAFYDTGALAAQTGSATVPHAQAK
jgi:hypothetical protein